MRYAWIEGVRDTYPLEVLCRVLSVSTSGFADWKSCDGPTQWLSDDQLLTLIRSIHVEVNHPASPQRAPNKAPNS